MEIQNRLTKALDANPSMQPFLKIIDNSGKDKIDQLIVIGELTNFFNLTLLKGIKQENRTPKRDQLSKIHLPIYHKMKFIEKEIFVLRRDNREKMKRFANDIIEFLSVWKEECDGMIIYVNQDDLKQYLLSEPKEVVILFNKFEFYLSLLAPICDSFSNKIHVINELKYVITDISKTLIPRLSFFKTHKLEDKFEILLLSDILPFHPTFSEFVDSFPPEDSRSYLSSFFQFLVFVLGELDMNKSPFDSTLVLLMIRLLFEKVYCKNPLLTTNGIDLIDQFKHLTTKEMLPPPEFSPKFQSDNEEIGLVFRNDPLFGPAVTELQFITFYTNPLDILYCLDQSLSLIEKAATEYNNHQTLVFPFEVTFELFMSVLISSQINNWYNISKMVEIYTTESGLCPSFEFSKAKIIASVMQLEAMKSQRENGLTNLHIDNESGINDHAITEGKVQTNQNNDAEENNEKVSSNSETNDDALGDNKTEQESICMHNIENQSSEINNEEQTLINAFNDSSLCDKDKTEQELIHNDGGP